MLKNSKNLPIFCHTWLQKQQWTISCTSQNAYYYNSINKENVSFANVDQFLAVSLKWNLLFFSIYFCNIYYRNKKKENFLKITYSYVNFPLVL